MSNEYITQEEFKEIEAYTIQKINRYPKHFGKTVDNYFHLLFSDEVKNYLLRRELNRCTVTIMLRKAEVGG